MVVSKAVRSWIAFAFQKTKDQNALSVISVFLLISVLNSCTIEILPVKNPDDGFDRMGEKERGLLTDADSLIEKCHFNETSPEQIRSIIEEYEGLTWLSVLSSWCPHALHDQQQLMIMQRELLQKGIQVLFVYTDFHPAFLRKKFLKSNHETTLMFMQHRPGVKEEIKSKKFLSEAVKGLPEYNGVPQHFLLDYEFNLVYSQQGEIKNLMQLLSGLSSDGDLPFVKR